MLKGENMGERATLMRTNDKVMSDLYEKRTQVIRACLVIQLSTQIKGDDYKTETIESPCKRVDGMFCNTCAYPNLKWKTGICNFASHLYIEQKTGLGQLKKFITPITMKVNIEASKKKLNPLKYSKRQG